LDVSDRQLIVGEEHVGKRLDVFLAEHLSEYSRVQLRRIVDAAAVTVDSEKVKPSFRVREGQVVDVHLPDLPKEGPVPENIPLEILYEDEHIAAVNKPPRMVVHPAKGHWTGTLTAGLAFHFQNLSSIGGDTRPGIVHRLDRDTSGVILVAKTDRSHMGLASQFAARTTEKEYLAIVVGVLDRDRDVIDKPIGAHPYQREKMAIRDGHRTSRDAQTFYEVTSRHRGFSLLKVIPRTGRTHQIRVHLASAGYAVLCDRMYGGRSQICRGEIHRDPSDDHVLLDRQALHARSLKVLHPVTNEPIEFVAPIPADIQSVLDEFAKREAQGRP
jgi:23S rRNA pseudouridine1911/1915/1917 synthase